MQLKEISTMVHNTNIKRKNNWPNNKLLEIVTVKTKIIVSKRLHNNVPKRPRRWSVRRPARSISAPDTKVVSTSTTPTPIVAYGPTWPRFACSNKAVE